MEAKLMRRIQRSGWDLASTSYERFWRTQLAPAVGAVLDAADVRPGERVLDVACGTGAIAIPAAIRVGSAGRVLATDLAPRMAEAVAERAADAGLDNVDVEVVGAEAVDLDGSVDVAVCSLGLMYVPDAGQAITAMVRAVRPGGRVVASVWGERRNCGWADIFPIVDARVSSDVCPMFFALGAPGALSRAMSAAGLVDVDERRLAVELVYPSGDDAAGAAFDGGPVALAASRFDDATARSARAEYLESLAPYADGDGYRVPGEFVIASGRRP
jgi:SAM-dependent methyltransferase